MSRVTSFRTQGGTQNDSVLDEPTLVTNFPLDTFTGVSLHCSPWESRPDAHESMHHAARRVRRPTLAAAREDDIGDATFAFGVLTFTRGDTTALDRP